MVEIEKDYLTYVQACYSKTARNAAYPLHKAILSDNDTGVRSQLQQLKGFTLLPTNQLGLSIRNEHVWASFFDKMLDALKYLLGMLVLVAHTANADLCDLPEVVFVDLGDGHFKLIAHAGQQ